MKAWRLAAAAVVASAVGAAWADDPLETSTIMVQDPVSGGEVQIVSSVFGPYRHLRFEYLVTNISYDPEPGETNLLSGIEIAWDALDGPAAGDGVAPPGWLIDLHWTSDYGAFVCSFTKPWEDGLGIGIGESATFGYTLVRFSDYAAFEGMSPDYGFTHSTFGPQGWFELKDSRTGAVLLQPVPGVGAALVLGAGGLVLGRRRR